MTNPTKSITSWNKTYLKGAIVSVALAALFAPGAHAADVNVAVVVDATGPTSSVFGSVYAGFRAYADRLNAAGGVSGQNIRYTLYDAQSTLPGAQAAARQALAAKPAALVHTTRSGYFAGIVPQYARSGTPIMSNVAPDSLVYPPKDWLYMPTATALNHGVSMVNFAKVLAGGSLKGKKIGLIISETPYQHEIVAQIEKMREEEGFELMKPEVMEINGLSASSQAGNIARGKPDFVIAGIAAGDPPAVIQALHVAGLTVPIIGTTSMSMAPLFERFKLPNYYGARDAALPADSATIVEAAKSSGTLSNADNVFYTHGWIMAAMVEHAMKECAPDCTNEQVKKAFEDMREVKISDDATFAPLAFSPTKRDGLVSMEFFKWDDEKGTAVASGEPVAAH